MNIIRNLIPFTTAFFCVSLGFTQPVLKFTETEYHIVHPDYTARLIALVETSENEYILLTGDEYSDSRHSLIKVSPDANQVYQDDWVQCIASNYTTGNQALYTEYSSSKIAYDWENQIIITAPYNLKIGKPVFFIIDYLTQTTTMYEYDDNGKDGFINAFVFEDGYFYGAGSIGQEYFVVKIDPLNPVSSSTNWAKVISHSSSNQNQQATFFDIAVDSEKDIICLVGMTTDLFGWSSPQHPINARSAIKYLDLSGNLKTHNAVPLSFNVNDGSYSGSYITNVIAMGNGKFVIGGTISNRAFVSLINEKIEPLWSKYFKAGPEPWPIYIHEITRTRLGKPVLSIATGTGEESIVQLNYNGEIEFARSMNSITPSFDILGTSNNYIAYTSFSSNFSKLGFLETDYGESGCNISRDFDYDNYT